MVIRVNAEKSVALQAEQGMHNYYIHVELIIGKALEHWTSSISIEGRRVSNLQYADDTALIASDEE